MNFDEAKLDAALTDRVASLMEQGDLSDAIKYPILSPLLRIASHATPETRRAKAAELRQSIGTFIPRLGHALIGIKDEWKKLVPTFRVLCLSEVHDVTPMWLLYADEYKGAALEFSPLDELGSAFLLARRVVYQELLRRLLASMHGWISFFVKITSTRSSSTNIYT